MGIMGNKCEYIEYHECNPDRFARFAPNAFDNALECLRINAERIDSVYYRPRHFYRAPDIKNVIFNKPATIVFWEDGDKTIVKCDKEKYDPEKGLVMAIAKKALGNKGNYYEVIKKWVGEERLFSNKKAEESEKTVKKAEKKNKK